MTDHPVILTTWTGKSSRGGGVISGDTIRRTQGARVCRGATGRTHMAACRAPPAMPPPSPGAVHAMDLFADVLVRADGVTYRVCDLAELDQAHRSGLILPGEADRARAGLAELTGIIERGDLLAFLSRACHIGPQI